VTAPNSGFCDSTAIAVPPPRSVRKEITRQRLLHAATQLLLTHGYTATSIDRIAHHAGCTRGTFFAHYGHKQQIGHDVAQTLTRHAVQRIRRFQPHDEDQLVTTLATWTSILVTRPGWIRLELDLADLDPPSRAQSTQRLNQLRDALRELLAHTTATAPHHPGTDLDITISFLLSVVVGMATQHTHNLGTPPTALRPHIELILRTARTA
jgi:AcrR family transcriptional regulator